MWVSSGYQLVGLFDPLEGDFVILVDCPDELEDVVDGCVERLTEKGYRRGKSDHTDGRWPSYRWDR